MAAALSRLLNIKAGEERPTLLLSAYYFFITATTIAGRSVSNALFFSRIENADLIFPIMLIVVTLTGVVVMGVYTRLARRIPLIPLFSLTGLLFTALLVVFRLFIDQSWTPYAFFVFMEVVNIILFFQFYIFAGTVFDTRQAKRIFGILGVGGALASILSGLALGPFTNLLGSEAVIVLTAGFMLLWILMIWLTVPYMRPAEVKKDSNVQVDKNPARLDGYLITMAVVIAATILVATIVEYQFKVIVSHEFSGEAALTAFFGTFFALVGFFQVLIRLFVVGNLLARFGVLAGLLLLPLGLAASSVAVLLNPMLLSAIVLKAVDQVLRYTLNETSMEVLWVPIPPQRKLAVKPLINGTIPTVLQGIAGLVIIFVVASFEVRALSVVILGIIAVWIPMTFRLRRGYLNELMKSLQQRELVLEDLEIDITDPAILDVIDRSLRSEDPVEQAFTLGMIEPISLAPWAETLHWLFDHSMSFFIKQKILDMARDYPDIVSDEALIAIIQEDASDVLIDEAIVAAGRRHLTQILPVLEHYLEPSFKVRPEIRAAAAHAVLLLDEGPIPLAQDTLRDMVESLDAHQNAPALATLSNLPPKVATTVMHESTLRDMLSERSTKARKVILEMAVSPGSWARENPQDNETILTIAENLEKASTRPLAQSVLRNYPPEHVVEVLLVLLRDKRGTPDLKIGVMEALQNYPTQAVAEQIINQLQANQLELYTASVSALLEITRKQRISQEQLTRLNGEMVKLAYVIYKNYYLLAKVGKLDHLLSDIIEKEIHDAMPAFLKLAIMDVPETQIDRIITELQTHNPDHLSNILEIFDNVLSRSEREIVIPLFEAHTTQELADLGVSHFKGLDEDIDRLLSHYIFSRNRWQSLVGLNFALRSQRKSLLLRLDWNRVPTTEANRQLIGRLLYFNSHFDDVAEKVPHLRFPPYFKEEDSVYTILEKTILLHSVTLFQDIRADEVFHIAQIAEEVHVKAGSALFNEGDSGDGLYVVVKGEMRIHKGEHTLASFKKGDALGEMALFDQLPRSASASAVEDSDLLRIQREEFFEVMASRTEIMQAVVRTLSLRVREANEQILAAEH